MKHGDLPILFTLLLVASSTIPLMIGPSDPLVDPGRTMSAGMIGGVFLNESHDMLILCPEEFRSLVDEFSEYRNATGIDTLPVNLEDVWSDMYWNLSGADPQEEMKLFIRNAALNWGIHYVMLAGDADMVPVRYILVLDGEDDTGASGKDGAFVPSDLYYSDIFETGSTDLSSWNEHTSGDHRHLWGEYDGSALDLPDLVPDLALGRIPASTEQELELMFAKIRAYELGAKGSDWVKNATLAGTDSYSGDATLEGEHLCDRIGSDYLGDYNVSKYYESMGNLRNVTLSLENHTGFAVLSDHGNYDGWGYTSNYSGVIGFSEVWGMDNGRELPVLILDACLTHGFDNENASDEISGKDPVYNQYYYPPGFVHRGRDSIAEYFHLARNGGAVATFGSTRVSYGSPGSTYPNALSGYVADHLSRSIGSGFGTTGEMLSDALSDYVSDLGTSSHEDYKTVTQYVLLGDPSLTVGGIDPVSLNISSGSELVEVLPGGTENITLEIHNTGLVNATLDIGLEIPDNGAFQWTANISMNSTDLGPGSIFLSNISIHAPDNAVAGQSRTVRITVDSLLLPDPLIHEITTTALKTTGVELNMSLDTDHVDQGSDIAGFFHVRNMGNGPETFHLDITTKPDGWTWYMEEPFINATPFQTVNVPFRISVPVMSVSGRYDLVMQAVSNITGAEDSIGFPLYVNTIKDVLLELPGDDLVIGPSGVGNLTMRVKNLGNSLISLSLDWTIPGQEGWIVNFTESDIGVDPFSYLDIGIQVTMPLDTSPETYDLVIRAANGTYEVRGDIGLTVPRIYSFDIILGTDMLQVEKDTEHSVAMNVTNDSNIYDRYSVVIAPASIDGIEITPSLPDFSVSSWSFRLVFLDIIIGDPLNGTYDITITVVPLSGTGNVSGNMRLIVNESYGFSVSEGIGSFGGRPGDRIEVGIDVHNEGNSVDTFDLDITAPDGWGIQQETIIMAVGPRKVGLILIDLDIPDGELAGQHNLRIIIRSMGSNTTRIQTFVLLVHEVYGIETSLQLNAHTLVLSPGRLHTLQLSVKNTGNSVETVDIGISVSPSIRSWISLETSVLTNLLPDENRTLNILIDVPRNVTPGSHDLALFISSKGDIEAGKEEVSLVIEEKEEGGILSKIEILPVALTLVIGIILIIVVLAVVMRIYRKSSGVDLEDAGMEWEEDEDSWDDGE